MDFKLINTLSGKKETVYAEDNKNLRFYCCGPTVYGPAHIGNFRAFTTQDVFRRTAEALGLSTMHVRNVTDFDDKTIRKSQEEGKSLIEFTDYWKSAFHKDSMELNNLAPHIEPSALAHIPEQIALIQSLVEQGHAYQAEDQSVYFRISSFDEYGKLSGLKKEDRKENADGRLNANDEYAKEDFADFALWKAWKAEDGTNKWESPWGAGRPGWHVECSAMSMKYLGESYDLHSGGVDLVFPHHENEIAQSEACTHKRFVRHWFHIAHLKVNGSKMSKSLGNLYTLEEVKERGFTAEELRYVLISGHYRQPLNFTWESLNASKSALVKLRKFKKQLGDSVSQSTIEGFGPFEPVMQALADDLNVAKALGLLFTMIGELEKSETETLTPYAPAFEKVMFALGFKLEEPEEAEVPEEVCKLAKARWEAKVNKDWSLADKLRIEIGEKGWLVKDAKDGYELMSQN